MASLNRLIRLTLAYSDVFGMPLSGFEVWKHLLVPEGNGEGKWRAKYRLNEVLCALEEEVRAGRVAERDGFYMLPGRESLVMKRQEEDKVSSARLKRVRRLALLLRYVPFLRMVGVTGSLALKQSGKESDWDLFVVLKSGSIFTGRTIVTGFLHLIGKRRHGVLVKDRACLNYFVTEDGFEIGTKDLFSAHEYRFLIPIFGFHAFQRFERKNHWISRFKVNALPTEVAPLWEVRDTLFSQRTRLFGEALLSHGALEHWLARWQKEKIRRNPKSALPGGLIEVSDTALIFLPKPRGPKVFEQWKKRAGEVLF
jgi:hypothetical protein